MRLTEERSGGLEISLPWPPSVNAIWRNVSVRGQRRTLLSAAGRRFYAEASKLVMVARAGVQLQGSAHVEITLHAPNRRAYDVDNRAKACLDALVRGGLLWDDAQVDVLVIRRGDIEPGGAAVVRVRAIPAEEGRL